METELTAEQKAQISREKALARFKRYREKHKEEIAKRDKEAKRWKKYYQGHKEVIKAKVMERYRKKKLALMEIAPVQEISPV